MGGSEYNNSPNDGLRHACADCSCSCWRHHRLHLRYTIQVPVPTSTAWMLIIPPGTVSIFRYGAGPNGIMRTLGQFMGASGATFGYEPRCFLKPISTNGTCAQLLHVRRQRHPIRLLPNCSTSLRECKTSTDHHGQQTTNFYPSIQPVIIGRRAQVPHRDLRGTHFPSFIEALSLANNDQLYFRNVMAVSEFGG